MGKLFSLVRACMTEDMKLFRFSNKKRSASSKIVLPVFLVLTIGFSIWGYANMLLDSLVPAGMGFVMLTLFVLITSVLTLVEGVYKSGSLLFNCRDDDLMLSLPVRRSTVLFVRVLKLYVFELLYNALFLVPAMIAYAMRVEVSATYIVACLAAVVLLPVIPIVIACPIGALISSFASRFKMKNVVQIVVVAALLVGVLFISWNLEGVISKIAAHATSLNDLITKIYYPAGAFVGLVTDFSVVNLLIFVLINVVVFGVMCLILGRVYFRINSRAKIVRTGSRHKKDYKVKAQNATRALIKKEARKFIDSPVFVVNAGFSLLLFVIACVVLTINADAITSIMQNYSAEGPIETGNIVADYAPLILMGLLLMATLMGSITSSMISLEGKSFNILKSLPVSAYKIIMSKVLTAMLIMMPFLIAGDIIMALKFRFNVFEILMILAATVIFPLVAEVIGIIVNLKYPKMDAKNDAEVVKQSASSMVAVFLGMGLLAVSAFAMIKLVNLGLALDLIMLIMIGFYAFSAVILLAFLRKKGTKMFDEITV